MGPPKSINITHFCLYLGALGFGPKYPSIRYFGRTSFSSYSAAVQVSGLEFSGHFTFFSEPEIQAYLQCQPRFGHAEKF